MNPETGEPEKIPESVGDERTRSRMEYRESPRPAGGVAEDPGIDGTGEAVRVRPAASLSENLRGL